MPLHKSTRGPRLDPTMISAPLGDFRHTMHIGRGGDAFGDTSFLTTLGPAPSSSDPGNPGATPAAEPEVNHDELENSDLQHSESVSSFTMDLDLDLGPSMLGDVLGVMDGLGLDANEEDVFSPKAAMEMNMQNQLNGKNLEGNQVGDGRIPDGIKPKGLRPKVRFSDKREEIIRQASEEDEGQSFDFQDEDQLSCETPTSPENRAESGFAAYKVDTPPSPASSQGSEYEGVTPLDRRRVNSCHSDSDSEDDEDAGRGYTFEDEFDDEIGL
ncbi:cdc42 effector protein 5 [Stegastes partitus]|uniref:Cdc42 effector protein 5 n=1 Tax=Stegastes partitus TaxID=144197 RepID=A0A9Y4N233_9TELE|nr:PREDICTED: cdc42 effector protein 5 [Stegastes partitus]